MQSAPQRATWRAETIAFNVFISIYLHLGFAGILLHFASNKHNTRNDN